MHARTAFLALGLAVAGAAQAQLPSLPTSIGIRGGYYYGHDFSGIAPGSTARLEGLELGADMPLFHLAMVELRLSPTVVFGGSLRHGADTDGNIYRIVANAKLKVPTQSWYVALGTGYAFTDNRGGHQFNTTSGTVGQATVGIEPGGAMGLKLYYELSWIFGDPQLSGLAFDVGIKF